MTVEVQNSGSTLNLKIVGSISEISKFPEINLLNISDIALDFGDINYINSAGVRLWIKWMWQFEKENSKMSFSIRRCPSRIARQIRAVSSFVPKTTIIKSFLVPYECDSCSNTLEKLFNIEPGLRTSLQNLTKALNENVICPKCNSKMELDAMPEDFFTLIQVRA